MKQRLKCQTKWWSLSLIVALASLDLGTQTSAQPLPCTDVVLLSQLPSNSSTSNTTALEIFRKAYENRYTWSPQFPGYTAVVELKRGKENYRGHVRINPNLSVEVTGIDNENARLSVENRVRMLIVHRRRIPFEVAHKNSNFQLSNTDRDGAGAIEIFQQGDKTEAHYKVFRQQIMQVNRLLGSHSVTVNVLNSEVTPKGYLATRYRTIFRQPQNKQVLGEVESEDAYKKIGDYYIPTRQVTHEHEQGQQTTTELNFTNIQLLSAKS